MSPRVRKALLGLGVSVLVFVLIEGACSTFLFGWDLVTRWEEPIQERNHTRHDPDLGWVNAPGLHIPGLYAEGADFTSNAQGFRNLEDFEAVAPAGRTRVICAGDSFTLGYGVDDDETWPAHLAAADERLQVVNMGQGGYGMDQAWLWYRRDGLALEHDLVLFAFIGDDFERMRKDTFWGYSKPLVRATPEGLAVTNVPVPRGSLRFPRVTQNLKLIERLRVLEFMGRVLNKLGAGGAAPVELDEEETRAVAEGIFEDLARAASERGARAVLVYLPNLDHLDLSRLDSWPDYAKEACRSASEGGLLFIDLTEDFAAVPDAERRKLFIPKGASRVPGVAGHYSAAGNAFVARAIARHLAAAGALPAGGD